MIQGSSEDQKGVDTTEQGSRGTGSGLKPLLSPLHPLCHFLCLSFSFCLLPSFFFSPSLFSSLFSPPDVSVHFVSDISDVPGTPTL